MAFIRGLAILLGIVAVLHVASAAADGDAIDKTAEHHSPQQADQDLELLQDLDDELQSVPGNQGISPQQAEDLDLFEELEQEPSGSSREGALSVFNDIGANLSAKVLLTGSHFLHDVDKDRNPLAENDRDLGLGRLELSTWIGGDTWRAQTSGWIEAGTQEDTWIGGIEWPQDKDYRRRYGEATELYLTLFGEAGDVAIGKKLLQNGVAALYSPANQYGSYDFHDPSQPQEMGRWQIRANRYIGGITLTGAILPVFQPIKFPGKHSRWTALYTAADVSDEEIDYADFVNFGRFDVDDAEDMQIRVDTPDVELENVGYFARANTSLHGWDVFVSAFYGLSLYDVIEQESENHFVIKPTKTVNVASGFSTTVKNVEIHAEGVVNYSPESNDDDFMSYVGGATVKMDDLARAIHLDQIVLTAEYAGEWLIDPQSADNYVVSSEDVRIGTNDIICHLDFRVNDRLNFEVFYNFELKNDGVFQRYQGRRKLFRELWISLSLDVFSGAAESYYGRWDKNDRAALTLEYAF